jgi:hypothetical protein
MPVAVVGAAFECPTIDMSAKVGTADAAKGGAVATAAAKVKAAALRETLVT